MAANQGLSDYSENVALAAALPNGTAAHVGLLTAIPTDGKSTGLVEASGSGYARVSHSAWETDVVQGVSYRKNTGAVEFSALTADLDAIVGFAIWDASVGGNLLAFGPLLNASATEVTKNFSSGDQPRFVGRALAVGIGGSVATTISDNITRGKRGPVTTTDATPTDLGDALIELDSDLEAFRVTAEVWGKADNGGTPGWYYRKIEVRYYRNDGGSGTTLWSSSWTATTDGTGTRVGTPVSSATADIVKSGDEIKVQVTGKAGSDITWYCNYEISPLEI